MTPKEKASQFVNNLIMCDDILIMPSTAIRCALVAVDEIINNLDYYYEQYGNGFFDRELSYWREVRTEIENLN